METTTSPQETRNGVSQAPSQKTDARVVTPPVDVHDNGEDVIAFADLPGVTADDLSLQVEKDTLALHAVRKSAGQERAIVYRRSFFIPNDIDSERIEAKLEDGVLRVRFPRRASAKPRQITVNGVKS